MLFWVLWGWLVLLPSIGSIPEARGIEICDGYDFDILNPTMLMHWYALCCCGLCLFLCGSCELCMTPLLNHFLSSISCTYVDIQTPWWDYDLLRCFLDCSLRSNVYYEMYLGCLWEPMGFWDLSMMSSVADIELLWMSFDAFTHSWRFWYSYCGFTFRYFLSSH